MKTLKRSSQAGSFDDSREHDVVDHCDHPMVAGFADLWHGKRGSRAVPDRADFEFEELAPWFGHVIIMDMLEDAADFRYRLVGTAVTGFLNRDYTGRTVMESNYSGAQQKVLDTFRRPAREGRPVFRRGYVIWAVDKSWRTYQSVHCPITAGGTGIAMTIGVLYFSLDPVMAPDGLPRDHWG